MSSSSKLGQFRVSEVEVTTSGPEVTFGVIVESVLRGESIVNFEAEHRRLNFFSDTAFVFRVNGS